MKTLATLLASLVLALVAGCGGDKGSSAGPPADFRVQAGDGSVIVTWTAEPDVDYWIFFGAGTGITTDNWINRGGVALPNVVSPRIITGLTNGITYTFTMNGRKKGGPGGDGAPPQTVVPMQAGDNWQPGAPLGSRKLNGIAAGTLANGFDVVTVGDGGVIYSSLGAAPYVERTNPAAGTNLNAAVYGIAGFMLGGDNGVILYSLDAIAWTQQTSGTTARLNAAAVSSAAQYVFVGNGGAVVSSSDAGTSWTTPASGVTADLYAATWGNLRFVAAGAGGMILTGSTGSEWSIAGAGLTQAALRGAAYGSILGTDASTVENIYVIVGDGGVVLRSTDSTNWTVVPAFTTKNLRGVAFGGRFVAVGDDGSIFTSVNGTTWEARSSGTTAGLTSVARQITGYTAVGEAGTNVSTF